MKKLSLALVLALLAACQNNPPLQDEAHYMRYARVVAVHVYTDAERREAAASAPHVNRNEPRVTFGLSFGTNIGGIGLNFGGLFTPQNRPRDIPPQPAWGADRYTVEPLGSHDRLEVESYGKYKVGDCVKLFSGAPKDYARLYDLQPGETCKAGKPAARKDKKKEKR